VFVAKALHNSLVPVRRKGLPQGCIRENRRESFGQPPGVVGLDQDPGFSILDDFWDPANRGRDYGLLTSQSFGNSDAERLGSRGQDKDLTVLQQFGDLGSVLKAEEFGPFSNAQRCRQRL
jgi:hypothetical protein